MTFRSQSNGHLLHVRRITVPAVVPPLLDQAKKVRWPPPTLGSQHISLRPHQAPMRGAMIRHSPQNNAAPTTMESGSARPVPNWLTTMRPPLLSTFLGR